MRRRPVGVTGASWRMFAGSLASAATEAMPEARAGGNEYAGGPDSGNEYAGGPEPGNELAPQRSTWQRALAILKRDWLAVFGIFFVLLLLLVAVFAPQLAPYPTMGEGRSSVSTRMQPPSAEFVMGTDRLGRDVLSRLIYGARPALIAPLIVVLLAVLIGAPLGAIAGLAGGWVDEVIMRICDLFLAFPSLLLAMAIVALQGPSLVNAVIALAVSWWPWYTRLVRGVAHSLSRQAFVEAARALGAREPKIMFRHILPNSVTPILVQASLDMGTVILATTGLAFIGLGSQPPAADWGLMIEDGRALLRNAWWTSTFPGIAIFLSVLSFNLVGDALRDLFDPKEYR
ncbi:MAG: ABC transporter permease [Trueperaceae bacterium]|nr:ABC transporter permease [Trueperaceae bacterium]HRQ10661.1 ABC transporter permease [Trueperaceae bacterium]